MLSRTRLLVVSACFSCFVLYLGLYSSQVRETSQSVLSRIHNGDSPDSIIANGTLGFGAIMVLGLPGRTDKRDALQLAASFTGLDITWVDGVRGDAMNPQAVPPAHFDIKTDWLKKDGEIGCWRGHMNVMNRIIKERISSALILEDDADWDVNIVKQMQAFAVATKDVLSRVKPLQGREAIGSPYGEDWDVLWIGHCGGRPPLDHAFPIAVISNDTTVPPAWDIDEMLRDADARNCTAHEHHDPQGMLCDQPRLAMTDRIVQYKSKPMCTSAYAVSYEGARKILARIGGVSLLDVETPVDIEIGDICRELEDENEAPKREVGRCLSVSPPYVSMHRARGLLDGDSDIQGGGNPTARRELGVSKGLVWSTKLNTENLLGRFQLEGQYVKEKTGDWRYRRANEYRAWSKPRG